jgi:hypothetical protein
MSEMTAGHRFVDTPAGETCANCGTRWLDLVAKRDQWRPGECGIAHQGFLTQSEVDELNAKLGASMEGRGGCCECARRSLNRQPHTPSLRVQSRRDAWPSTLTGQAGSWRPVRS